jgi:hypothetical protein
VFADDSHDLVQTFPSIAALRESSSRAPGGVFVKNYYANARGGGGLFSLEAGDKSSPDDGCTVIIDAAGHRYHRVFDGDVYVTYCGAKVDGTTDDAATVTAAIAAANRLGRGIHLGFGKSMIGAMLVVPRSVSVIGYGRDRSQLVANGPFRVIQWTTALRGYEASGQLHGFTVDGRDLATEGILVAGAEDARLQNVTVTNINGRALVLHALQNGRFDQVELSSSNTLLFLTNGAWNNIFTRLELAHPKAGGYHLLSQNDPAYITLTGIERTRGGNSGFNQYFGILFEGGDPTNVIRLESDVGNNYFASGEISASSMGAQIYIGPEGNNNYFGPGLYIQRVRHAKYAIESYGMNNIFDGCTLNSWRGVYAKTNRTTVFTNLRGGITANGVERVPIGSPTPN